MWLFAPEKVKIHTKIYGDWNLKQGCNWFQKDGISCYILLLLKRKVSVSFELIDVILLDYCKQHSRFELCNAGVTFQSMYKILKCDHSNGSYFVVPFIMLYKMVLTIECVDEILKCGHSNEIYWAVLSCDAVCYAVQGGTNFWVCWWIPKVWPFKWKLPRITFLWCCLVVRY